MNSSLTLSVGRIDFRKPVDVGEAALDVAAMLGGGALIAELRPQLFLIVERDDEIAAHLLEKVAVFDAAQQLHAIRFPRNFGVSQLVPLAGVLIEPVHSIGDQRLCGRVFRCLVVPGLDCGDVVAVG